MAFAEVSDIEARWRELSEDEAARAEVLLDDASVMLSSLVTVDGSAEQAGLLKQVTCNMVIRAMSASGADTFGAESMSMTAGPYSQSWQYANPSGDMYLTKLEKRLLGITSSYIGSIRPKIGEATNEGD